MIETQTSADDVLHWLSTLILLIDDVENELEQMQVYDAKGDVVVVLQGVVHRSGAINASYVASSASIMVGEHTMHLQGIEIVKSLEPIVIPLRPPDVQLKVTIETVEIKSLICVRQVSMSGILDVSGIHVLQVDAAECQLLGGNEEIAVWLNIADNATQDTTKTPFAKVSEMSCLVTMKSIIQATSIFPFDSLKPFEGDHDTTIGSILQHYSTAMARMIQERLDRSKETTSNMCDGVAVALGCAALNTTIATPIGLAASLVAVGVKDGIKNAASAGKVARGETPEARYQFGDVSRGVVASFRQSKSDVLLQDLQPESDSSKEKQPKQSAKSRYGAIGGSSVGAVVGLTLIGGPVGLLAGSWIGGSSTKKVIRSIESTEEEKDESPREANNDDFEHDIAIIPGPADEESSKSNDNQYQTCKEPENSVNSSMLVVQGAKPYQFGDLTRGIVSRGKKTRHKDDNASYQFGDFTRGLFS
jgi:hypothetical protein